MMIDKQPTTGYVIWRLATQWRTAVDRAVKDLGLTHATYSVVTSLLGMERQGRHPTQRELADHTGLEPVYISRLVTGLEATGMLSRQQHPGDSRAVVLSLTADGEATAEAAISLVHPLLDDLMAPLGGTDGERGRHLKQELLLLLDWQKGPSQT